MARFSFRLQTVLDERQRAEERALSALAASQRIAADIETKIDSIHAEVSDQKSDMRDHALLGRLDVPFLMANRRYFAAQLCEVARLSRDLADARLEVESRRRKLAIAARERKALEVLRDKQKQRWQAEQEKRERTLADEIALQIGYEWTAPDGPGRAA